jgi:hypothetical protein
MTWWRTSRRVRGYARMVREVLESKSPRREPFLRERARKIERRGLHSVWEREGRQPTLLIRDLGPTGARQVWTVRDTPADSPRGAQMVRTPGADCPLMLPEHPEVHLRLTSHADGPRCPSGQSTRSSRTVRPVDTDGPTSFLISA